MLQCYSGDAQELFRPELESLELDYPEMHSRTTEESRVATQGDHALSVLCQFVVHGLPPDKFHVPTVLIFTHAGMSWQYVMVFCTTPSGRHSHAVTVYYGKKTLRSPPG